MREYNRSDERWDKRIMLKDYVAKGLQFFQIPVKSAKSAAKQEEAPLQSSGPFEPVPEEPAEAAPAEATESDGQASWEEGDPFAEPDPPERAPGQDDYEAGILAYRDKKPEEALAALIRAAGAGHMEAQFLCGHMYQHGIAAEENCRTALGWYKRSAKQGFLRAQMVCAAMYEEGVGTKIDLKRALAWYEQAAKQGDVSAQLKCGRMYHSGRAETRNPKKARYWLEIAARNGSEEAQRLLLDRF